MSRRPGQLAARRRGSSYVAVLGLSVLVVTLAVGGSLVASSQRAATTLRADEGRARAAGFAALDLGAQVIAADGSWRSRLTHGTYSSSLALASSTVAYKAVDEADATLTGNALQPIRLYGVGRAGLAVRAYSVELVPTGPTLDALSLPLYTADNLTVSGTVYASGGPLVCGGLLTVNLLATLDGSAECWATLNLLGSVTGGYRTGVAPRTFPQKAVVDSYAAMGTTISFGLIPSGTISAKVISPTTNPYGTADADGVYVISVPAASTLTITNCRIEGTLVVNLGLTARLVVTGANLWEAPAGPKPILLVRGTTGSSVQIGGSLTPLSEAAAGVNFNPLVAPHGPSGDTDLTDTYPAQVRGLALVTGSTSVTFNANAAVRGCWIVEGAVSASGAAEFVADPHLAANPPWGFFDPTGMTKVDATWRREATP